MVGTPCLLCTGYLMKRSRVLQPAVAEYAELRLLNKADLLREFMEGVHKRHLAGLPLFPAERAA